MPEVIFARPRWNYDSYTDLYRLIELSGFPLCFIDEIDAFDDKCIYIVTMLNGEVVGWPGATARIILWDFEWHVDGGIRPLEGLYDTWAADAWYARQIGAKYVPLGSHPGLNLSPDETVEPTFDVVLLQYLTHRRQIVRDQLSEAGVTIAPNGWGMERHRSLQQARACLHVHQLDTAFTVAPQRFALAAAYRLPIISETLSDSGIFGHADLLTSSHEHLAAFTRMWTHGRAERERLADFGHALYQKLCVERTFRHEVEAAL